MTERLLPRNASPLELALEQGLGPDDPGAAVLRTLWRPAEIPAALLPWLGWGDDVPAWPADEGPRRSVCAKSHRLHGLIGTAKGLAEGARLQGGELRRLDAPPGRTFLGGRDAAARRRWLEAQPELRLYPRRERAAAEGCQLGADFLGADEGGASASHPCRTTAIARSTLRATRVYQGVEAELGVSQWAQGIASGTARVDLGRRTTAQGCQLGADFLGADEGGARAAHPCRTGASARLWTVQGYRFGTWSLLWRTLGAGFDPLSADVEAVAERAPEGGLCCPVDNLPAFNRARGGWGAELLRGSFLGDAYPSRAVPERRLYWRTWLHDPAVAVPTTGGLAFLGRTRLNVPAFHAEAGVAWPRVRAESALLASDGPHFLAARDTAARLKRVLGGLGWFRAEADRILVNPHQYDRVVCTTTLKAGTTLAGAILARS